MNIVNDEQIIQYSYYCPSLEYAENGGQLKKEENKITFIM